MRLLILALLTVAAGMTACGPRDGQASPSPGARHTSESTAPGSDVRSLTAIESAAAPDPAPEKTRQPIHPMAAAAAKAHLDGLIAKRKMLESQLGTVRSIIARHNRYGQSWLPDPDRTQSWETLIGQGLDTAPINPFSPSDVASHIAFIDDPGAGGELVSPKTAGWVWNEHDRTLDAARDSAALRVSEREERRRLIRTTYGPHLASQLRTLRGQIALYSLYETPLWGPNEVASQQWAPLIDAGYIFETPVNPLCPRDVSRLIVEVTARGANGGSVSPNMAGWVWNSVDRKLFAAGYHED